MQGAKIWIAGALWGVALLGAGAVGCNSILGIGDGTLADASFGDSSSGASGVSTGISTGRSTGASGASGSNSGTASGSSGGLLDGGVEGSTDAQAPPTGAIVVAGTDSLEDGGYVLEVLEPEHGTVLSRETLPVVAVMYDGSSDVWYVFETRAPVDARTTPFGPSTNPGDPVVLHVRQLDTQTGHWTEAAPAFRVPTPVSFGNVAPLSGGLVAYIAYEGADASVFARDLVVVDTMTSEHPVGVYPLPNAPIGLIGTASQPSGGRVNQIVLGPCPNDGGPCQQYQEVASIVTGSQGDAGPQVVFRAPVPVGPIYPSAGQNPGWASFANAGSALDIFAWPVQAIDGGQEAEIQLYDPQTNELALGRPALTFNAGSDHFKPLAIAECFQTALLVTTDQTNLFAIPLVNGATQPQPLGLGHTGQSGVYYEPYMNTVLAPINSHDLWDITAFALTGTRLQPQLAKRMPPDWSPPKTLRPNGMVTRAPSDFRCPSSPSTDAGGAGVPDAGLEASSCSASMGSTCGNCGGIVKCDGTCSFDNPMNYGKACGSCGGTVKCDGTCSVVVSNYGTTCGNCGGTVKCDGTCSVATPNNYGQTCGSCGTVKCDGSCSATTPPNYGTTCGNCGGTVKCDGTCSVATPMSYGQACGSCGGTVKCDGTCSIATPLNYGKTCGSCNGTIQCDGQCTHCPPLFNGVTTVSNVTTTGATLSWSTAAKDDVTPASQIVYLVYQAMSAGGEDFMHPTASSMAGAVSIDITGLTSNTTYYWVVRARDSFGKIDSNTTEMSTTTLVSFSTDLLPIFQTNCTSNCHSPGAMAPDGLVLTSAAYALDPTNGLVNVQSLEDSSLKRVKPFDAANSYLYRAVEPGLVPPTKMMPVMSALMLQDISKIHDWIQQGAQNN
jgi:hypothetical protein